MDRSAGRPPKTVGGTSAKRGAPGKGGTSASAMSLRTLIDLQAREMLEPQAKHKIKYVAQQFTRHAPEKKKPGHFRLNIKWPRWLTWIFMDNPTAADMRLDLTTFKVRIKRLRRVIVIEAWAVLVLLCFVLSMLPVLTTHYEYFARPLNRNFTVSMVGLRLPNLTRQAIVSWVASTVTETMTYSFANFNQRIAGQKNKFVGKSWNSFVKVMLNHDVLEKFMRQQMVLTTAPTGVPVIIGEGMVDGEYQWTVQVPILMKYVTNNNRFQKRTHVIELNVIKVPTSISPDGIAIRTWNTDRPEERIVELTM